MERPFGEGPRRPGQNATKRETIFQRRPAGQRRRQGNLGFISFLTSSLSCGDAPVGARAGRGTPAKPYRGREQPGPRCRASTHPMRPGLRFCLRWKTGTQERLGKVPSDPWPGRDGRAFAVYLISRRPPPPHFLALGLTPPLAFSYLPPPGEQGPDQPMLHEAWHVVGPQ